jgi:hypothetical protein
MDSRAREEKRQCVIMWGSWCSVLAGDWSAADLFVCSSNHVQAQVGLKGIRVTVVMQKGKAALDDERRDQAVYRLAYRDPPMPQGAVVLRALDRYLGSTDRIDGKLEQRLACCLKVVLASIAL